ncbi:repeat set, removed [Histoplasma ohiense]|nr:repeat set, removed [Histoplasma ohiense (nom. inval.)]
MADQDEAAVLRHHIAQLDDELHQMRAASTPADAHDGNELSPDLAAHLRDQGDTPALSRVLQEFRERVKFIQKPGFLKSASNYPIWKEEILLAIKQSHTDDILTTKPLENASKDMK